MYYHLPFVLLMSFPFRRRQFQEWVFLHINYHRFQSTSEPAPWSVLCVDKIYWILAYSYLPLNSPIPPATPLNYHHPADLVTFKMSSMGRKFLLTCHTLVVLRSVNHSHDINIRTTWIARILRGEQPYKESLIAFILAALLCWFEEGKLWVK